MKQFFIKIKDWFKRQIKFILGFFTITVALAAGSQFIKVDNPEKIIVEGNEIVFQYCNSTSTDTIQICTDENIYAPIIGREITIYVSVKNNAKKGQSIDLKTYFTGGDFTVISADKMAIGSYSVMVDDYATATGATGTYSYIKGNHKESKEGNVWVPITTSSFDKKLDGSLSNQLAVKKISHSISKKESQYYRFIVKTPYRILTDEFSLEVSGSLGAYGLLDPTVLTETFNSYGNGTLNGTSSWSGGIAFKVQGTTVYEGAKAVNITGSVEQTISKSGTSQANGTTSVYIRSGSTNNRTYFTLFEGANQIAFAFGLVSGGNIGFYTSGGWVYNGTWVANTWYQIQAEWRSSDKKMRFRVNGGSYSDWYTPNGGNFTTGIDKIGLYVSAEGTSLNSYFDYIAEDPYVAPSAIQYFNRSTVVE